VTDIFEEVNEGLRQDTFSTWWKKYQFIVIGVIVVAIGSVGFWEFFKDQRGKEIERQAKVFDTAVTALNSADLPAAKTAFAQIGQDKGGFGALANLMLASVEKDLTNDPKLMEQHLRAAAERDNGLMKDMATLKLAYARADTAQLADLEAIVKPLVDKGGYYGALARELVAAKALAGGDVERARAEYQALSFEIEAPSNLKLRVSQALGALPKTVTAPAAAPATAPSPPAQPAPAQQ
jgi:hypothetical protein